MILLNKMVVHFQPSTWCHDFTPLLPVICSDMLH